MKNDIQDPLWTAYALGELSSSEQAEAERLLVENSDLASEVIALKQTLEFLKDELGKASEKEFEPLRREAILQEKSHTKYFWVPTAAAAVLAVGFGISHLVSLPQGEPASSVVQEDISAFKDQNEALALEAPASVSAPMETRARVGEEMKAKKDFSRQRLEKVQLDQIEAEAPLDERLFRGSDLEADTLSVSGNLAVATPTPTLTPTPIPEAESGAAPRPQLP